MSGVGRGRGWLNIKQPALGGIMITTNKEKDDVIRTYMSYIDNTAAIPIKYSKAFRAFETIKNEELLKKTLKKYEYDDEDIRQCILLLIQEYLVNWNMSFEAIANAFKINRKAVLNSAQNIYENNDCLYDKNKPAVVKLLIMLSKLQGILPSPVCVVAVIHCVKWFLEPVHIEYVPIVTKCLHQIIKSKKESHNEPIVCNGIEYGRLEDILRAAICSTDDTKTRYWLFLARDIWLNGPHILPEKTLEFYAQYLGQTEMNYFRRVADIEQPLHLDTSDSCQSLDQYVSTVSVLKIDDSPPNHQRDNGHEVDQTTHTDTYKENGPTTSHQPLVTDHVTDSGGGYKVSGRAILGAGARKNRNNNKLSTSDGFEQQVEANGWQEELRTHRGSSRCVPPPRDLPRNHTAWNHDDRC